VDVAHAVQEEFGLGQYRGDDARMGVPGIRHTEGRGEVDEAVVVDVPDVRSVGAFPEDRCDRLQAGHVSTLDFSEALCKLDRAWTGDARQEFGRE